MVRWCLVVVAVAVAVAIGLPLVGVRVLYPSDIVGQYYPWRDQVPSGFRVANPLLADPVDSIMPMRAEFSRSLRDGRVALWSPYPGGGTALGAVPSWGVLSPLNLPYLVVPLWYAPALATLLELIAAVLFTFLFVRRMGLGKVPAVVGGLIYAFSGFQVVWTFWPQAHIGALVPALFWGAERALQRGTVRSAIPLAFVVAVMLLEGFPPVTLYAVLAAGLYVVVRVAAERGAITRRVGSALACGGGVAAGAALTAFQLLPFARSLGSLSLGERAQSPDAHLPLRALATLFLPNAFGSPVDRNFFGRLHYAPAGLVRTGYVEQQSFIGAVALVLIVAAGVLLWPRSGPRWLPRGVWTYLWVGTAVAILLIYVGGPPLALLQKVPPFDTNYIGRLRSVMGFFLACLAAVGLQALEVRPARDGQRAPPAFRALVVVGVSAAVSAGLFVALRLAGEVQQRRYVARQAILPGALAAIAVLAMAAHRRERWSRLRFLAWIIPALVAAESLAFVVPFWPRVSKDLFYPSTPAHLYLQRHLGEDRLAAREHTMDPGTTTFYGLRAVTAHVFFDEAWSQLLTAADPGAFKPITPTLPILKEGKELATSPLLDRFAVRYFVDSPDRVYGRSVPGPPAVRQARIIAGSSFSQALPPGRPRGVAFDLIGLQGSSADAILEADVVRPSGQVVSRGSRRLRTARPGRLVVPIPEAAGSGSLAGTTLRMRYRALRGTLILAAGRDGSPTVTTILAEQDGLQLVFAEGAAIYRRLDALPRIHWAPRATVIPAPGRRVFALARGVPSNVVVLSGPGPAGSGAAARLRVERDGEDEIRVTIRAAGVGYLVVADALQHGWVARLDGRPVALRAADHACVAVLVPPGRHQVVLRYEPPGWKPGLVISGVSLVILVGLALGLSPRRIPKGERW
jgi:hypothetical protein